MAETKAFGAENKSLKDENKSLNDKVNYLLQSLFGAKSEKIDPNQLTLLFEARAQWAAAKEAVLETDEALPARRHVKRRPLAARLPDDVRLGVELPKGWPTEPCQQGGSSDAYD